MSAFVSARSSRSDTAQAAREVADAAGDRVAFALVYADEKHDLAAVERALRAKWGSAAILGSSTSGEITADGAHEGSIVALAATGEGFSAATALATGVMKNPEGAARELARQLAAKKGAGKHTLIVADPDNLIKSAPIVGNAKIAPILYEVSEKPDQIAKCHEEQLGSTV